MREKIRVYRQLTPKTQSTPDPVESQEAVRKSQAARRAGRQERLCFGQSKLAMKTIRSAPVRHRIPAKWAWHYRTLVALHTHLLSRTAGRLAEPFEGMEPPSLHCEDLAAELYDHDLAAALPADPALARREIEDALHRIADGRYGKCAVTGRPMPKALLRAAPWRRTAWPVVNPGGHPLEE